MVAARFLTIFLALLPLALWGQLGGSWNHWATIPAEFIIAFFLFGIEEVSKRMQSSVCTTRGCHRPYRRCQSYGLPLSSAAQAYVTAVLAHPHFIEWRDAALQETMRIPHEDASEQTF